MKIFFEKKNVFEKEYKPYNLKGYNLTPLENKTTI